jgi:hypothetical protein
MRGSEDDGLEWELETMTDVELEEVKRSTPVPLELDLVAHFIVRRGSFLVLDRDLEADPEGPEYALKVAIARNTPSGARLARHERDKLVGGTRYHWRHITTIIRPA